MSINKILASLEELSTEDLTYIFEYLVDLINERKEKCRKNLKQKKNLG